MLNEPRDRGRHRDAVAPDWFARAFNKLYTVIYAHRTVGAAAPEAEFAARVLSLASYDRVLDLACGNGRHIVHLLRRASQVVGLDYSADMLTLARENVGTQAPLVRADMRALPFAQRFDVVVNFFTSFGYFQSRAENEAVVKQVAGVLADRGRFFIDYVNAEHVRATLVPHSNRSAGPYAIAERRWLDDRERVNKCVVVRQGTEHVAEQAESVQLYSPAEFAALLEIGGLHVEEFYGDYDGSPLDSSRPRMIATGRKA